jgi:hypothetical protein
MTLAIALRPPFTLPRILRAQSNESRQEVHWVGQDRGTTKKDKPAPLNQPKPEKNPRGYRPLGSFKLGEVEEAISLFKHQIVPVHENWAGKDHFCTIPLKRIRDGRPPLMFGFVRTCYPSDGFIENVEDIELAFPRRDGHLDLVHIQADDISRYSLRAVQSHALRVQFRVSAEDEADLSGAVAGFAANGFHPEFERGYYDLLELNGLDQGRLPLFHVIGSRWLASLPESLHGEVISRLKEILGWGKVIVNYHPDWLPREIHTLNRELDFQYGFTSTVLVEPRNPAQIQQILGQARKRLFEEPANRPS